MTGTAVDNLRLSRWSMAQKLVPPDAVWGEQFGGQVAIYDDTLLINAHLDSQVAVIATGSTYVYKECNVYGKSIQLSVGRNFHQM